MNKKFIIIISAVTILLVGGGVLLATSSSSSKFTGLDDFAKCLTEKGATMYGAYWCPHCINTKKAFGQSFKYIQYVECTVETKKCEDNKVAGYPTWIFGDGSRLEGEQSLQDLAAKSQCKL